MDEPCGFMPIQLFETVLDVISVGVWLLDDQHRIVVANFAARQEMQRKATIAAVDGVVCAVVPSEVPALHRALAGAQAGQHSMVQLGAAAHGRTFAAVPLAHAGEHPPSRRVLLVCGRGLAQDPISLLLFAKAVGITPCERDVLQCLCDGLVAEDIARTRSVKLSTVRTQISSLREKIGARNVPQLMARMSRLPPLAHRDTQVGRGALRD